uniref:Uncharacterized protein n=1 Tax=Eucampia antarctica TaxID=49252 RepID=A0A7S2RN17_9STRA|mmetsp:Transcript_24376/g.23425  ORF Transcript_24376/g.23425 Transcript_24376/m.23425 type:complete len:458 (+) Transcript_24376:105-1478(+)
MGQVRLSQNPIKIRKHHGFILAFIAVLVFVQYYNSFRIPSINEEETFISVTDVEEENPVAQDETFTPHDGASFVNKTLNRDNNRIAILSVNNKETIIDDTDAEEEILAAQNETFTAHDGVAFVTKTLHHDNNKKHLQKMICLVNAAYNYKVNYSYDFIIFTTLPWPEEEVERIKAIAFPAKLSVILEGPPLDERVAALSEEDQDYLLKRCGIEGGIHDNNTNITWFHHCTEKDSHLVANLGYSWQAEFRSYHIWTHSALKDYTYMMWFDGDAQPAREWDKDPVDAMVQKNLSLMYTGFPYGTVRPYSVMNKAMRQKLNQTYGKNLCRPHTKSDGSLGVDICKDGENKAFDQVAGYWHLTNLDVYRKEIHQKYLKLHIGPFPFSRQWDDQIAVTVPAAYESLENPGSAVDMSSLGMHLKIRHHRKYDAKEKAPGSDAVFIKQLKEDWPEGYNKCHKYF